MKKYYICGGRDTYWIETKAKTLNGAKAIASKTYQHSVGGKIEVAEGECRGEAGIMYTTVAVKHGYDKWQTA